MVEILRSPETVFPPKERPNFEALQARWKSNKLDFLYDNNLAGRKFGLPTLAEIQTDFDTARGVVENIFEIQTVSLEDGEDLEATDDDDQEGATKIVVGEKLVPKNANYSRDAIFNAVKALQVTISRLITPLSFLSNIIIDRSDQAGKVPESEETSSAISPLEQTRNQIRSQLITLLEFKKQMIMFREASMPLHKIMQDGKTQSIQRGLRAVRESEDVWSETTDLHWQAINDCVAVDAVIDASNDDLDTEINPVMRQRHEKYLRILMTYSGSVQEILENENFAQDSEAFWRKFRRVEVSDFTFTVYNYLKYLENKRSGLLLLSNLITPRHVSEATVASIKKTKAEIPRGTRVKKSLPQKPTVSEQDVQAVKTALNNVQEEIQKLSPIIALLAQRGFLKQKRDDTDPSKDKWARLSSEFSQFKDSLFPVFEYIQEKPKVGGDITYGVLRDKKTGNTYSIARFGGSIPEALKKLGGRLSVPRRKKKT